MWLLVTTEMSTATCYILGMSLLVKCRREFGYFCARSSFVSLRTILCVKERFVSFE